MSDLDEDDSHQRGVETLNTDDENEEDNGNPVDLDNDITDLDISQPNETDSKNDGIKIDHIPHITELRNTNQSNLDISTLLDYIDLYSQKINTLTQSKQSAEKKHRGSVIDLHNKMFKKLMDTENDQKIKLEEATNEIAELQKEVKIYKMKEDAANNDNDNELTQKLNELLENEKTFKLQIKSLEEEIKKLTDDAKIKGLKEKEYKEELNKTSDSHRKSISTLHTNMFKKLLDAEDEFEDQIDKLQNELNNTKKLLQQEQLKSHGADKLRRDSIQTVHNNMLTKLLDAQAEHDEDAEKLREEVKHLRHELRKEQLTNEVRAEEEEQSDVSDLDGNHDNDEVSKKKKDKEFDKLWGDDGDEDEPSVEIQRLKDHIKRIEMELAGEKEKNVHIEKQRKDSIHNLHNNMFQKLLDAEFEYEEEIERLHKEKEDLNEKIIYYEDHFDKIQNSSDGDGASNNSINPTFVIELKQQIKDKDEIIASDQEKMFELTDKITKLENKCENIEKQRRGSVSFLSKQMMDKLLEAEEESQEQKDKYQEKVTELESALANQKENAFNIEKTRRNSLTTVSKAMFQKLLTAEQSKKELKQKYEDRIAKIEQELEIEKLKNETSSSKSELKNSNINNIKTKNKKLEAKITEIKLQSEIVEKKRRESFSELRNNMWKTLLDAEDDYETQIKKLKKKVINQNDDINTLRKDLEFATASKLAVLTNANNQIDQLRKAVTIYHKSTKKGWF